VDLGWPVILVVLGLAGALAGWAGHRSAPAAEGVTRSVEAAAAAVLGGGLALGAVAALWWFGDGSDAAALAVGWVLFFVHGAVDSLLALAGMDPLLTRPDVLAASAVAVGATTGGLRGVRATYPRTGAGLVQLGVDSTWALAGSTTGTLLHVANLARGHRQVDERTGAVRFASGLHPPGRDFAVTLGAVLSNCDAGPGEALYEHERTHVRQSRLAGPLYLPTYLLWMAVALLPALTVGAVRRAPVPCVEGYCYYSNPWEVWAYRVHRQVRCEAPGADVRTRLARQRCLSEPAAAAVGLPFVLASASALGVFAVAALR
jgi:hypothetical protein